MIDFNSKFLSVELLFRFTFVIQFTFEQMSLNKSFYTSNTTHT